MILQKVFFSSIQNHVVYVGFEGNNTEKTSARKKHDHLQHLRQVIHKTKVATLLFIFLQVFFFVNIILALRPNESRKKQNFLQFSRELWMKNRNHVQSRCGIGWLELLLFKSLVYKTFGCVKVHFKRVNVMLPEI